MFAGLICGARIWLLRWMLAVMIPFRQSVLSQVIIIFNFLFCVFLCYYLLVINVVYYDNCFNMTKKYLCLLMIRFC